MVFKHALMPHNVFLKFYVLGDYMVAFSIGTQSGVKFVYVHIKLFVMKVFNVLIAGFIIKQVINLCMFGHKFADSHL